MKRSVPFGSVTRSCDSATLVKSERAIERLGQDNLREEPEELRGELQGVLPKARVFEFKLEGTAQVIRGKIGPAIIDPDALSESLHQLATVQVMVTRVGSGRPRYLLIEAPSPA